MRKESFLHTHEEHERKLESLCRVQCHQRDARTFFILICVTDERGVIEKLSQRLSAIGGVSRSVDELLKILNSGKRLGTCFLFQSLHITSAIDQEPDDLR